jgi:hypothetical protein
MASGIKIDGLNALKRAMAELEPKVARRVVKQAMKRAMQPIADAIKSAVPVLSGKLRKSVRIRVSKGPRGAGRKVQAMAVLVGASGKRGDKEKGIVRPWWAYLIEQGWTTGKRVRSGGKVVGRIGKQTKVPGKHIVRQQMRAHEARALEQVAAEILAGIEAEAGR